MEKTLSGIPKKLKSRYQLLRIIRKMGGDHQYVGLHRNQEPGTGDIHKYMWMLHESYLITIEYKSDDTFATNDNLFIVRITNQGMNELRSMKADRLAIITLILVIISLLYQVLSFHIGK